MHEVADSTAPNFKRRKRQKKDNSCNRHFDCDAADEQTLARGGNPHITHCYDECCEDCFGY